MDRQLYIVDWDMMGKADEAAKLAQVMRENCLEQGVDVTVEELMEQAQVMLESVGKILRSGPLYVFMPSQKPVEFSPKSSDVFTSVLSIFKLGGTIGFKSSSGVIIPIPYGKIEDE